MEMRVGKSKASCNLKSGSSLSSIIFCVNEKKEKERESLSEF